MYAQPWHPDADRELTEYEGEFIGPPDGVTITTLVISGLIMVYYAFIKNRAEITFSTIFLLLFFSLVLSGFLLYPIWFVFGLF